MNHQLSWRCLLGFLVLATNSALAAEATYLQTRFEAGKFMAVAKVLQSNQSEVAEVDEVAAWLRTYHRQLADDLAVSRLVWVKEMPAQCPTQRCACTSPQPRSDIWLLEGFCASTTLDQAAIVRLLVHEGVHHLGVVDEVFADRVAAIVDQSAEQVTAVAVRSQGNVTLEVARSNQDATKPSAVGDLQDVWVVESDFRSGATSGLNGPTSLGLNVGYQLKMRAVVMTARQGRTRVEWDQVDDPDHMIQDEFENWEPVLTTRTLGLSGRQHFGVTGRFYTSGGIFEDTLAAKPRTSDISALALKLLRFELGFGYVLPIDDQVGALLSATGSVPLQQTLDDRVAISEVHTAFAIAAGLSARL